jgi:NADH-quinone oxidoreductase subunit L
MSRQLWALVWLPAAAGAVLLVIGTLRGAVACRLQRAAGTGAVAVAAVVLLLALRVAGGRPDAATAFLPGAPLALGVDALAAPVVVTVAVVSLLVLLFAAADIHAGQARFFGLMLVFLAAVLLTTTAATLPVLLAAWEVMGATSYALIAFRWRDAGRVGGGNVAFLATRAGDVGLYLAAGAAVAGSTASGRMDLRLGTMAVLPSPWVHVAAAGVLAAGFGKAAQLPFSFWLSRAMQGPSPVSALLHSAAMVAMGGYLLLRMHPLLATTGWAAGTAAWGGALTALLLGAVAVAQRDLKQLLAASTAAQLGFVVLAAGTTAAGGAVDAGSVQLMAHAATKALLFLAAGAWLSALGTKQLPALRGAARRYRVVGVTFTAGALALAGIPPLSLWAAKDAILAPVREQSLPLYVTALAAALLSAVYAGKMLALVWRPLPEHAERGYDTEEPGSRRVSALERLPLVVLAVGAVALGVLTLPVLDPVLGRGGVVRPSVVEPVVSGLLAVLGTAVAVAWPDRLPPWAAGWLGLQRAVHLGVVTPTLALARLLARGDAALYGAVLASAPAARSLARATARVDTTGVGAAVRGTARSAQRLGTLARRPQTGQLHQYYAQAAVGLGAALLLVLAVR